jgi:hypothetical protein
MEDDKCISKCYKKNTNGYHPLFLNKEKSKPYNFCFTNLFEVDKVKKCNIDDENINNDHIPTLNFNEKYILNNIYNIYEWQDIITFIEKKNYENIETLDRILIYSWVTFENKWYNEILNIINIYIKYFNFLNLKISSKKINDLLFNLKNEYLKNNKNINDCHNYILKNL